ncbi:pyrimidine 5'-nucleotidase [Aspergillus ibericus CBS 121593]|uniref:Pyrimidine 5'-nucleotidase n=1 Tax=Aspergillus ibericus CBS 121593 TaxID=1448316 RepID=A0A395HC15_9EURO|nr:pyrimidine 5'-nucleotidase [Aspergillus ibericus CBS 121593]RAL04498.1 pyrimidine 5'-nucleotidase [Aspergillus ibericus CBS 121593]
MIPSGNPASPDSRIVFFFDIDNCLYSRACNVQEEMTKLIRQFFITHLSLTPSEARILHQKYHREYGFTIDGLSRHHNITPLVFNQEVDDALPLEKLITPDPQLRKLLLAIDKTKVKLWLFTNAYITHAKRVVKLLQVEDLFEGITYCDYACHPLVGKPSSEMYEKAEREAGALGTEGCYFVDDSYLNCKQASERGWKAIHLIEPMAHAPQTPASPYTIQNLEELRSLFPSLFNAALG